MVDVCPMLEQYFNNIGMTIGAGDNKGRAAVLFFFLIFFFIIFRLMMVMGMLKEEDLKFNYSLNQGLITAQAAEAVGYCDRDYWLFTKHGGMLTVHTRLLQKVKKGDHIATLTSLFGFVLAKYHAPEDAIVIGQSKNPGKGRRRGEEERRGGGGED